MANEMDNWLMEHADNYKTRMACAQDCMKKFGCHRATVYKRQLALGLSWEEDPKPQAKKRRESTEVLPADKFLGKIDRVKQVLDYLNDELGDDYIEDDKLRRRFGIPKDRWREMVGLPCFESRVFSFMDGETQRRMTVWSSKVGIEKAKRTISMDRYAGK